MTERFAAVHADLRRHGLLPEDTLAVLVGGSMARGWTTPTSDWDVSVVSVAQPPVVPGRTLQVLVDPPTVPAVSTPLDGRRGEVKFWVDRQVDGMLAKVSRERFAQGRVAGQALVDTEEVFLERLLTSVPLAGADWLERRRRDVADSAFGAFMVVRTLARSDDSAEDAVGLLAAGDTEGATIAARRAFGRAIDALCESHGEYGYWLPKWRPRRMRAAAPAAIGYADYWAIETMRDYDPDDPAKWVERVLRVRQDVVAEIEVDPG